MTIATVGKRLVKSPRIYIRDTGLLHYLLNIQGVTDQARLIYFGNREFDVAKSIHAVNIEKFLRNSLSDNVDIYQ